MRPFASDPRWRAFSQAFSQTVESGRFGDGYIDPSICHQVIYADLAPHALSWIGEWAPRLEALTDRRRIALAIADRLDRMAAPFKSDYTDKLADALRAARRTAAAAIRLSDQKWIRRWDLKTGNSRVDPDDAREEANRFIKRVQPKLEELVAGGAYLTYAVFTTPNVELGKLREECSRIYRRYVALIKKAKRGKLPGCASIDGSLAVLEAPLSARGNWNVHLNVVLVHRSAFIDYGELRRAWFHNVEFRRIEGKGAAIGAALREVIKYAVTAVAEKSQRKARPDSDSASLRDPMGAGARGGRALDQVQRAGELAAPPDVAGGDADSPGARGGQGVAPAFVDWCDLALGEWLQAFRRFRRTRTYGLLYRLPKRERLDLSEFVHVGQVQWHGRARGYRIRFPLLDSIPGDKSARGVVDRVRRFFELLAPGVIRWPESPQAAAARGL